MRKGILLTLAVGLLLGASAAAQDQRLALTGWVSDEYCGAKHAKPGEEDCVKKCLAGGAESAHPEGTPQRMVLVSDKDRKIWIVQNPKILEGYEGRHVRLRARVYPEKKSIRVVEVSTPKPKPEPEPEPKQ